MTRILTLTLTVTVAILTVAQATPAQSIPFNTGYDHNAAAPYPYYTADGYWKVVDDPDAGTSEPRPAYTIEKYYTWASEMPGSRWISSYKTPDNDLNGVYVFEFCFYLDAGFTSATIEFDIRADDSAVIYLNGTAPANKIGKADKYSWNPTMFPTPPHVSYSGGTSSLFQTGNNIITVALANTNKVASGFDIVGTITADASVEAGCLPATGAIQGMKWDDGLVPDCMKGQNEPVLDLWEINLSDGSKTWTDKLGNYYFYNLTPGTYTVTETQQTGWIQNCPASGSWVVTVVANQTVTDKNFGNIQSDSLGSIQGTKWEAQWPLDCSDPASKKQRLPNWKIHLNPGGTQTTDGSGNYSFTNLQPGTYTVTEAVEPGWIQDCPESGSYAVTVGPGQVVTGLDFLNVKLDTNQRISERDRIHCTVDSANDLHIMYWSDVPMTISDHWDGPFTNFEAVYSKAYTGPPHSWYYECTWSGYTVTYCEWVSVGVEFIQAGVNKLYKDSAYWTLDGVKVGGSIPLVGMGVEPPTGPGPLTTTLYNDAGIPLVISDLEVGCSPNVMTLEEMSYQPGAVGPVRTDSILLGAAEAWDSVLACGDVPVSVVVQGYAYSSTGEEAYFVTQHQHSGAMPCPSVTIEKTENTLQGHFEFVSITTADVTFEMGGFDFLIAYDASALTFMGAEPGQLLEDCGWEYFTYRYGADGNCGDACPSGLLRIVAIAETNNGPNHPSCYGPPDADPHELAELSFLVSNDRTLACQYVPIRFFWIECTDNTISNVGGDTMYVSDHVYDFEGTEITDSTYGFPTYFGAQPECLEGGGLDKPTPIRLICFVNGGIDIICSDSIDVRGDINCNGLGYEIADAVMFSNYLIYGLSAFDDHVEASIAASDVNADGIPLSVADLVYLIRVVAGDAVPYNKLEPVVAEASIDDGVLSVGAEAGAAFVVVENEVQPVLLAENMAMKYYFDAEQKVTRVLVFSMDKGQTFEGEFLSGINGEVVRLEMVTYYGAPLKAALTPSEFALHQCFPNPFNPVTTITFSLPVAADYELAIINTLGQTVKTFEGHSGPGIVDITWDASGYASGVYFYRLKAGEFTDTKKMVLLR
jgi:hypothetical protein